MPKKAQIDKFREKARELKTDDDEGRFDEALKRVAQHKSTGKQPQKAETKPRNR